jgi:hypothetical protein
MTTATSPRLDAVAAARDSWEKASRQVNDMQRRLRSITGYVPPEKPQPSTSLDTTDVTSRAATVTAQGKEDGLPPFEWVGQHAGEVVARADLPAFLSWAMRLDDVRVETGPGGITARGVAGDVVWNLSTETPVPVIEPITEDLPVQAVVQAVIVPELGGES